MQGDSGGPLYLVVEAGVHKQTVWHNRFWTMQGDSGGPLYLVSEAGVHKQIGITSFGSSLGCEIGMHAGFTR